MRLFPGRPSWRLFEPLLAGASLRDRIIASAGALAGVGFTAWVSFLTSISLGDLPLMVAPIGASAVLLFAIPSSPLSQPWPIIGGNIVSALVGVAVAALVPNPWLASGLAVGAAMLAMSLLRCLHPPGGASALLPVLGGPPIAAAGYAFAIVPVGLNAICLVLAGVLFHRLSGHSYPHRPVPVVGHKVPEAREPDFVSQDIDAALAELGETFDVAREDLDLLFRSAERHARLRRAGAVPDR